MEHNTKCCPDCNINKPTEQYHKCRANPDGLQIFCKICQNARTAKYRKDTNCAYWKHKLNAPYYIYTITNPEGMIYVGYTSITPTLRWQRHRAQFKSNSVKYFSLFESFGKYGVDNHVFLTIEEQSTEQKARQAGTMLILRLRKKGVCINQNVSCIPVGQYNKITGELVKNWESVVDAAKSFGHKSSRIYYSMKFKKRSAFGYVWKVLPFEDGSIYEVKKKQIIEKAN